MGCPSPLSARSPHQQLLSPNYYALTHLGGDERCVGGGRDVGRGLRGGTERRGGSSGAERGK